MPILIGGSSLNMWVLSAFEKHGDRMVKQLALRGRRLFRQPDDDPMYYMYPVTPDIANALADHVEGQIKLNDYDYFLDYKADQPDEPV